MPNPTETHEVLVEAFDQLANRLALPPSAERRDTTSRELGCKKGRPHRTAGRVPTVPATLTNIVNEHRAKQSADGIEVDTTISRRYNISG